MVRIQGVLEQCVYGKRAVFSGSVTFEYKYLETP